MCYSVQAELGGLLSDELNLLLVVSLLVVFRSFVDVLLIRLGRTNPISSVNVLRRILNGSEATLPKTGFRPGGVASPETVSLHRTQPGVVFVADQLADGSRFRSLTVVEILGLTFF